MLKDIWRVIIGKLSWERLSLAVYEARRAQEIANQQSHRANEAVRLYNEGEIARKQSSDALGNAVIKQMLGDK